MTFFRTYVFTILCVSAINFGSSQNIEKGQINKDRQYLIDKKEFTVADDQGNFVSIRPHNINGTLRNYFIEFYDGLNFDKRIEIETQNDTDILKVFIANGKIQVFIKETVGNTISLRIDIIDLKDETVSKKILYEADKDNHKAIYKALKSNYSIDLNGSFQFLLTFPVVEDKNVYVVAKVFSEDWEPVLEQTISPDTSASHRNTHFLTSKLHDGNVYMLFQINDEEFGNYYKLVAYADDVENSLNIDIDSESSELINSSIKEGLFIIGGLYSNQSKGGYSGFTYYNVELETLKLISKKQSSFQNEAASKYFKGFFKKNRDIDIKELFIDDQQNAYIVGQFYKVEKQTVPIGIPLATLYAAGSVVAYISYNPISISYKIYDDMIIGKINRDGNLDWDNLLELRQTEKIDSKSNKRDSSIKTVFLDDQVHIFMNGFLSVDNGVLEVKQNKRLSKTNFYDIAIAPDGSIVPKIIVSNYSAKVLFRAENIINAGPNLYNLGQGNMIKQLLKWQIK